MLTTRESVQKFIDQHALMESDHNIAGRTKKDCDLCLARDDPNLAEDILAALWQSEVFYRYRYESEGW